jgi:hypothetical protein
MLVGVESEQYMINPGTFQDIRVDVQTVRVLSKFLEENCRLLVCFETSRVKNEHYLGKSSDHRYNQLV